MHRCGICARCRESNCGECSSCKEMPQFGGTRRIKQACINRQCQYKSMKYRTEETQPSIKNIFKNIKSEEDDYGVKVESTQRKYEYEYVETDENIKKEVLTPKEALDR